LLLLLLLLHAVRIHKLKTLIEFLPTLQIKHHRKKPHNRQKERCVAISKKIPSKMHAFQSLPLFVKSTSNDTDNVFIWGTHVGYNFLGIIIPHAGPARFGFSSMAQRDNEENHGQFVSL
jgi:hypothetical protein